MTAMSFPGGARAGQEGLMARWGLMVAQLVTWPEWQRRLYLQGLSLQDWLRAARQGESRFVACETLREKSDVQSMVNRAVSKRQISVAVTRLEDGILVERL